MLFHATMDGARVVWGLLAVFRRARDPNAYGRFSDDVPSVGSAPSNLLWPRPSGLASNSILSLSRYLRHRDPTLRLSLCL